MPNAEEVMVLLALAGDPEPQMTIDFVGLELARQWAEAELEAQVAGGTR